MLKLAKTMGYLSLLMEIFIISKSLGPRECIVLSKRLKFYRKHDAIKNLKSTNFFKN